MSKAAKKTIQQHRVIPQVREAIDELHNYMATLFWQDGQGRAGSDVLVNTCGVHGILTCHHVSKPLMEFDRFGLCIAEYPHALWVDKRHVEHLVIGAMSEHEDELEDGPDLSFIIIRDVNLLGIIKSKKSFCFLDTQDLSIFKRPLSQIPWGIVGCPFKNSKFDPQPTELTVGLYSFAGMAVFLNRKKRKGFDYLKLRMPNDGQKYPEDFKGLSGGGMWAITLKSTTSKAKPTAKDIKHGRPVLAGINFFQSFPNKGWRTVTGHGFESIYKRFRRKLKRHLRKP